MRLPIFLVLLQTIQASRFYSNWSAYQSPNGVDTSASRTWGWIYVSTIINRLYDWWYGDPRECRDLVLWDCDQTSAEEWFAPENSSSSWDDSDSGEEWGGLRRRRIAGRDQPLRLTWKDESLEEERSPESSPDLPRLGWRDSDPTDKRETPVRTLEDKIDEVANDNNIV